MIFIVKSRTSQTFLSLLFVTYYSRVKFYDLLITAGGGVYVDYTKA
jgi:hypothetical protein